MNTVRNIMLAATLITAGAVQANGETPSALTESKDLYSKNYTDCYGPYNNLTYPFGPALEQPQVEQWMTAQRQAMEVHWKAQLEAMQAQQKAINDYMQRLNETYRAAAEARTETVGNYGLYPTTALPTEPMNAKWKVLEDKRKARIEAMRIRQEEFAERMQQLNAEFDAKREAFEQRHKYYIEYPVIAANDNAIAEN